MKFFVEFQNSVCWSFLPWWVHDATIGIDLQKYNTKTFIVLANVQITIFAADIAINIIFIIIIINTIIC